MEPRVMVMAGGTGGHVFPALAVADWLRRQGCDVFWLGTPQGMEASLVPQRGYRMETINVKGVRGTGWRRRLAAPFVISHALWQAWSVLRRNRPSLVLGMGGFVTGPGGLMARLLRIPLVIQEQNAIPGLTNRILARFANRVFEAFPNSFGPEASAEASGNPVRAEIADLPEPEQRFAAHGERRRLLVLGGSLGARVLNQIVPAALAALQPEMRPQVLHQAGKKTLQEALDSYRQQGIEAEIRPFLEDMAAAYAWADLVICRAGALTVSELAAAGLGALLVPFPHAVDDHQTRNAGFLVEARAALLIPQSELNAVALGGQLQTLLANPERLLAMAQAARKLAQPQAAAQVGRACLEVMQR